MAQDIRKLVKEHVPEKPQLPKGHEARFKERLQEDLLESYIPLKKQDRSFIICILLRWLFARKKYSFLKVL